ncbi:MAG: radical SAM protein [Methyloceanibacter sp.]|uniref:radical SAM protein n=1 Tax=Methyloceanibacter sp. TaxID=1965321 RepID=UPI001D7EBC7E|nr:radical SAM protein [Methyloceanibacter sp.]MCB1442461.1 radical SAM protein [Methyloceanibacter sp.]
MTDAACANSTEKFADPDWTADGTRRARVPLDRLRTLWINTGTLCNIACRNCYIESSPTNDSLAYIRRAEAARFLDEIRRDAWPVTEIGFTGGEPFLNPDILPMLADALECGFSALVLTNAMQPMMRQRVQEGLLALRKVHGGKLRLRISLDHYSTTFHDEERGTGSFDRTIEGIDWLAAHGFAIALAGRTCWGESEADARAGYAALARARGWPVDAASREQLVLFPEMDGRTDISEITDACWDILKISPDSVMCASSRMVVKPRGETAPVVVPCTLLTDIPAFAMGSSLAEAEKAHGGMFDHGAVKLCHPHCARFCVLGGGSCSSSPAERGCP